MGTQTMAGNFVEPRIPLQPNREAHSSGVSWGAVIGGAFVTAALYLILLALGAGFELSAVSPWSYLGSSGTAARAVAIVWLVLIEIIAAAVGGYLTGRLRTKWAAIHNDEVFFRDTANGFLSWAVAFVVSVAFLASAAATMVGAGPQPRTTSEASTATAIDPNLYFVDTLFRSDRVPRDPGDTGAKAEAARILDNGLKQPGFPASDEAYLERMVTATTGLGQAEAAKRVSDVLNQARQAQDAVRKTTAHFLLWSFLSLLMGAFSASYAATIGGRQRDHVKAV